MSTYRVTFRHPAGHLVPITVEAPNKRQAINDAKVSPDLHRAVRNFGTLSSVVKVGA